MKKAGAVGVNNVSEGGFSPALDKLDQAIDLIADAASSAGLKLGTDLFLYIDYGSVINLFPAQISQSDFIVFIYLCMRVFVCVYVCAKYNSSFAFH